MAGRVYGEAKSGPICPGYRFFCGPYRFAWFSLIFLLPDQKCTYWACHPGHLATPDQKWLYWVPVWASRVPFFSDLHKVELWLSWGAGFCYPTVFFVAPTGLRCSSPKMIHLKTNRPVHGITSLTGIYAAGHIYIYAILFLGTRFPICK